MDNEIQKQDEQVELLTGKDIPEEIRQKLPEGAVVRRVKRKKKSESETIREIRRETRNRSELAQLQRAKQGLAFQEEVLKDAPKEDFTPKTFRQKLANFWYHNKMWSGVFILIAVLLGMGIKGWFFPPKYDVDIVLASELPLESRDLVQPMNLYTEDFDQNGRRGG